jgi:hypothetical protein
MYTQESLENLVGYVAATHVDVALLLVADDIVESNGADVGFMTKLTPDKALFILQGSTAEMFERCEDKKEAILTCNTLLDVMIKYIDLEDLK